ncbi:5-oxoprolinase subunit C family protein [Hellea balneolensis]|uniref:5-oxoprolinase subunit C family protein n=1 Tax=Hellea balneolensis TaxID=287478 RepID=UPI000406466B|nr:biotin-dependent carboxyltransferase family protein [Hellea balneolensis]
MIEVLNGGTRATIQDAGRPGYRHLGIPQSGAADKLCFALANWMAGNRWDAPAIECALGGLHLRFNEPTTIALAGAEMWAQINGQNVKNFSAMRVEKGDILTLSFARDGCRAYIAIAGGLKIAEFMGSASTYLPAEFGGFEGRALRTGDTLAISNRPREAPRKIPQGYTPRLSRHIVLRARSAAEWETLDKPSQRHLFVSPFHASAATDRMGSRLRGDRIKTAKNLSMTSSPLLPGTLQVPPDGQPILMLVDGHCTGGYPRALQIIRADLWLLGQIAPGSQVSFRRCFTEQPPQILQARNSFYGGLIDGFAF